MAEGLVRTPFGEMTTLYCVHLPFPLEQKALIRLKMSFWKGRKVIVTGGAGLVGSHLCDLLVDDGAEVHLVDDFSKGTPSSIQHLTGKIQLVPQDIREVAESLFDSKSTVMHLASKAYGIAYSKDHHAEMLKFNKDLNTRILDACRKKRVERLCVVSSSCVYPDDAPSPTPELPVMTRDPEKANEGYGWAKRYLEIEAQQLARETSIPVAIVRPFNAYSERYKWEGDYSHVIPMLVKRIMEGENPLVVWGSGNQTRNFLHAIDFARCFLAVTEHYAQADPVNVGYEETICIKDLAALIGEISGRSPQIVFDSSKPEGRLVKSASSEKLKKVTGGIQPTISLHEGLQRMIGWYERTFGKTSSVTTK
jgi:UDP-glucose 4-epimerase